MNKFMTTVGLAVGVGLATGCNAAEWPDLPVGLKNGITTKVGDVVYAGLGSAGTAFYALDLGNKGAGWQELAGFPGPAPSGAAFASSGDKIYVFSGSGKANEEAASPIIFEAVHTFDTAEGTWQKVETTTPAGLLGATALTLSDGRIAITGGYNKQLFDTYLADILGTDKEAEPEKWQKIVDDYMGMAPEAYRWNTKVLVFDPQTVTWGDMGETPYLPNTGAAAIPLEGERFLLVNGEIKPGLRTPQVKEIDLSGKTAVWREVAQVPTPLGEDLQEGLAGAYAGYTEGGPVVAGGANFKGARANAYAGQWFAHNGLAKQWVPQIFGRIHNGWVEIGSLGEGFAYGGAVDVDGGLLLVGGEDSSRTARPDVRLLKWDGSRVSIEP